MPISSMITGQEQKFEGQSISPGLGAGLAALAPVLATAPAPVHIEAPEIPREIHRLQLACEKTREQLRAAARKVEEQLDTELAEVFQAHEMMLDDLTSSAALEEELERSMVDAEEAVRRVLQQWEKRFLSLASESFRQRADDVADLARKLLRNLTGEDALALTRLPPGSVLVTPRLLPSDVVLLSRQSVAAIVVGQLGTGAHAALLAREKSIPTVAGFPDLVKEIRPGDRLLIDASRGTLILHPAAETEEQFQQRMAALRNSSSRCRDACRRPALTSDGERVRVEANLGTWEDVDLVVENGADGVGLFRTEQLYLSRETPPTEDELLEELRAITSPLRYGPVTVRLLDAGGDKPVPFLRRKPEENPQLGLRGVRLLLTRPALARTQLRALLRLAQEQEIRVLVPLVTMADDLVRLRILWREAAESLPGLRPPPFGAMVETPAAALTIAELRQHVDFFSVGTNDLAQYTMAAARDNPAVSPWYNDSHTAVLRLLRLIRAEAGETPISVCGELASREDVIPALIGMGYRSLSVSPPLVPAVKEAVRMIAAG